MNIARPGLVRAGGRAVSAPGAPTIVHVEWATAMGWHRRQGRTDRTIRTQVRGTDPGQLAAACVDVLRVGILVLDAADAPVVANPAAHELGLVRTGVTP